MQIQVTASDANNIICQVTPTPTQTVTIDRGVAGNGIVSIVPVTIGTLEYLRITYTNGTVSDVGPITSTAYTATSPINIVGNTISLLTVPVNLGGTGATTAAAGIQNLLPSYTGNGNKRLGLNSGATALEWVADGGGTVTSVNVSGGTTGLTTTGGPITGAGTITLTGTLAVANGGTGSTTSTGTGSVVLSTSPSLVTPALGTPTSGNFSTGTFTWPTFNQNTTGNAATATTATNVSGGTASVTTLTTSSTVTLNGGTANGVAYLNGSKVLTTGSALQFDGTTLTGTSATSAANLVLNNTSGATQTYVNFTSGATVINAINRPNATNDFRFNANYGSIVWGIGSAGTATEQMRLTSTGLGIGTSSPGYKLDVNGGAGGASIRIDSTSNANAMSLLLATAGATRASLSIANSSSDLVIKSEDAGGRSAGIQFWTGNASSERARIDSSGNLLVGTTVSSISSGAGIKLIGNSAEPYMGIVTPFNNGNNTNYHLYSTAAGGMRFYVGSNGQISAVSTTISAISDQRLKENVQDLDVGLDKIMALKPRKFDWKAGKGKDIKGDRGFIAQEFEQVFPDMIDTWKDPSPEGEEPYKSVRADLIPVLVKAIQELKAEFDAYKATHP